MAFDLEEKFLKSAEDELGCRLPDSFRQAIKEDNGGGVLISDEEWRLHPILDSSNRKRISRTSNDLTRETRSMQSWPGWPKNAVAIGANGSGDAIVFLCTSGRCDPQVYEWSHETAELKLVAGDFSELARVG